MIKEKIKEKVIIEHLNNGLDVILIPKKNAVRTYAMYATHFGSLNYKFKVPGEAEITQVPDGVAHFLEHKLFEEEDGVNALDKLSKLGANANAYTSFNHTAYLFSCTEKFDEAFDALLKFVQNPYLTDENVEKEKGIIGQEIKMYDDDPDWQLFFGFLNCLYGNHAITKDIAGTVETIADITPEILYSCYNTFYDPSNMVICVAGNIDTDKVLEKIKSSVKDMPEKDKIERYYGDVGESIVNDKVVKKMDVSIPMFIMGFKDTDDTKLLSAGYDKDNYDRVLKHVAIEILLEILVGKSTKLYEDMYNEGLVTREFGIDYTFEEDYAYSSISGESNSIDEVVSRIKARIEELKKNGIDEEEFERIKRMLYGSYVKIFDSVSSCARVFVNDYFRGINSFDYVDAYRNITIDYAKEVLDKHFDFSKMALSVVDKNN